jgi:Na+-transporting NADH:ubiquinone oxidoreductase subunit NqrC
MLYIVPTTIAFAGTIEKIAELIKQGNAHELSKYFSSNVEITILDDGNVYSKAQSEMILEKFFKDNKPRTVKLLHRINSNSTYNFGVLILSTDKGNYRVSYTLKEVEKVMVVIELRIETEKT